MGWGNFDFSHPLHGMRVQNTASGAGKILFGGDSCFGGGWVLQVMERFSASFELTPEHDGPDPQRHIGVSPARAAGHDTLAGKKVRKPSNSLIFILFFFLNCVPKICFFPFRLIPKVSAPQLFCLPQQLAFYARPLAPDPQICFFSGISVHPPASPPLFFSPSSFFFPLPLFSFLSPFLPFFHHFFLFLFFPFSPFLFFPLFAFSHFFPFSFPPFFLFSMFLLFILPHFSLSPQIPPSYTSPFSLSPSSSFFPFLPPFPISPPKSLLFTLFPPFSFSPSSSFFPFLPFFPFFLLFSLISPTFPFCPPNPLFLLLFLLFPFHLLPLFSPVSLFPPPKSPQKRPNPAATGNKPRAGETPEEFPNALSHFRLVIEKKPN